MIATFEKPVIDVPDLEAGARFWSALTGFAINAQVDPTGRFLGLGAQQVDGETSVQLLLQRVDHPIAAGSVHLDFKVKDVGRAIAEIEAIGGRLRKPSRVHPETGEPYLEWAVMEDPWGTPFCIIRWPL